MAKDVKGAEALSFRAATKKHWETIYKEGPESPLSCVHARWPTTINVWSLCLLTRSFSAKPNNYFTEWNAHFVTFTLCVVLYIFNWFCVYCHNRQTTTEIHVTLWANTIYDNMKQLYSRITSFQWPIYGARKKKTPQRFTAESQQLIWRVCLWMVGGKWST